MGKFARFQLLALFVAVAVTGVVAFALSGGSGETAAPELTFKARAALLAADSAEGTDPYPTANPTPSPTPSPSPSPSPSPTYIAMVTMPTNRAFDFELPGTVVAGGDFQYVAGSLWPTGTAMKFAGTNIYSFSNFPAIPADGYETDPVDPVVNGGYFFRIGSGPTASHGEIIVKAIGGSLAFDWRLIPPACGGSSLVIWETNKGNQYVNLYANGSLAGWYVISVNGGERFDFPSPGVPYTNNAIVQLFGKPSLGAQPFDDFHFKWQDTPMLDAEDDLRVYNCEGTLVQIYEDPFAPDP